MIWQPSFHTTIDCSPRPRRLGCPPLRLPDHVSALDTSARKANSRGEGMPLEGTSLHEPGSHGEIAMAETLFDRLGGLDAITAVVGDFRDRVARDDRINLKFARTDLARLTKMLIDQICEATVVPVGLDGDRRNRSTRTRLRPRRYPTLARSSRSRADRLRAKQHIGR